MLDTKALKVVVNAIKKLNSSQWGTLITIRHYVVDSYIEKWRSTVKNVVGKVVYTHTFGAYYRLFAHEILPAEVQNVLYMDTDVVILANIDALLEHCDKKKMITWGLNTGFIILNIQEMGLHFWDILSSVDLSKADLRTSDQALVLAVAKHSPQKVGDIPKQWTIHVADGAWKYAKTIVKERPEVGMLHFNGGGGSTDPYWTQKHSVTKYHGWNVVKYYINLPWGWVKFIAHSNCVAIGCHELQIISA